MNAYAHYHPHFILKLNNNYSTITIDDQIEWNEWSTISRNNDEWQTRKKSSNIYIQNFIDFTTDTYLPVAMKLSYTHTYKKDFSFYFFTDIVTPNICILYYSLLLSFFFEISKNVMIHSICVWVYNVWVKNTKNLNKFNLFCLKIQTHSHTWNFFFTSNLIMKNYSTTTTTTLLVRYYLSE